ncbi:helix-turn-helix transcriptional regulator [Vagococcus vulneris]|uniref:Transcriptional regulator n=1 Tax=Vagococcus vulneris TaxID=1977869 RepID=A0A429ZWV0_9ENTE|nr:helix-turn-helix transcriptional regulator [Vagococcus vulneris]RST98284.1 transcriptional regulator [Vagococcus vulneris]
MKALKKLRSLYKLTQKDMANRLGVSYSHYIKLENGFVGPSFNLLQTIKREFPKFDMNELFK